jgi:hypothetical protein
MLSSFHTLYSRITSDTAGIISVNWLVFIPISLTCYCVTSYSEAYWLSQTFALFGDHWVRSSEMTQLGRSPLGFLMCLRPEFGGAAVLWSWRIHFSGGSATQNLRCSLFTWASPHGGLTTWPLQVINFCYVVTVSALLIRSLYMSRRASLGSR